MKEGLQLTEIGDPVPGAPRPDESVRRRLVTRRERYQVGKSLRGVVPFDALAYWRAPDHRPDVVDQVIASHEGREARLIPLRIERMAASPFSFLRGAADVLAWDVSALPATGIMPVICGDAHLGNVGFYRSPEGNLVIDLNDFDEAHTGSWEWDLRRLTASVWVAGRENNSSEEECHEAAVACVEAYREEVRFLSDTPLMSRAFNRLDVDRLNETVTEKSLRGEIERTVKKARRNVSDRKLPKISAGEGYERRIVEDLPVILRVPEERLEQVGVALDEYLERLTPQWRRVVGSYYLTDVVHKVVGVGSVGLRAYLALLEGSDPNDVLFLQLKQARRSVIAPYVHGDRAWHRHQGQRVVEYQQDIQTVSDPLLGWATVGERHYYVRQWRNQQGTIDVSAITPQALRDYAGIIGHLLAKGHARTSGASRIAGYLGKHDYAAQAFARWARAYADQTEADHAAFVKAIGTGRLPVE
ncbi:MAG TPA: DUF2252 domain-containing protein [Actinomycetaceae bacterium]|nr:DUF2252 domain-containing protein [Actinomycetaceae bacterium]